MLPILALAVSVPVVNGLVSTGVTTGSRAGVVNLERLAVRF